MYAYDANLEARSRGHKPGITTKSQAFYQIHETTRSDKSWIEICNYRGECVRISCPGGHYVVESVKSKLRQEVALGSIDRWTDRFLIIGLEEITEPHAPRMPLPPAPSEPKLVIFLSDQETGVHINMAEQDIVDLTEALNQFDRLSEQEGSSIGFKRNDGQLLKFTWNEGSILQVDIPLGEGSSLRGRGTWDGLRPLIPQFAAGVPVRELPGLQLQSGSLRRNLDESL
jgi:hypothetical protein